MSLAKTVSLASGTLPNARKNKDKKTYLNQFYPNTRCHLRQVLRISGITHFRWWTRSPSRSVELRISASKLHTHPNIPSKYSRNSPQKGLCLENLNIRNPVSFLKMIWEEAMKNKMKGNSTSWKSRSWTWSRDWKKLWCRINCWEWDLRIQSIGYKSMIVWQAN